MSFLPNISSSSTLDALITRKGRIQITDAKKTFKITKFALADDEINYNLLNPDNIDQDDPDIVALPIPEPSTNESTEMIHRIYRQPNFLDQRFNTSATSQAVGQYISVISSEYGDKVVLSSDDTVKKVYVSVTTYNNIERPYVADYYNFKFTDEVDCYTIDFIYPALTNSVNNNFTKLNQTEYIFNAGNSDGSGKYQRTPTGAPTIVFAVRFTATSKFYEQMTDPRNKSGIVIPNFVTVTQIDSARQIMTDVRSSTLPITIKNII